jgi:hypothetical protein
MFGRIMLGWLFLGCVVPCLQAQTLTIEGISDRTSYTDSASFRVVTNSGFRYGVTLNGVPVSAGVTNRITRMDY